MIFKSIIWKIEKLWSVVELVTPRIFHPILAAWVRLPHAWGNQQKKPPSVTLMMSHKAYFKNVKNK